MTTKTDNKKTLAEWTKAKRHTVTLPSGFEVDIEIPNLQKMVKTGEIPNELINAAIGAVKQEEITPELIREQSDFYYMLVVEMVKAPQLSVEDVDKIPYEDVELLVELGTRQRDIDAMGHHIAGLHKSKDFRRFRGLEYGD